LLAGRDPAHVEHTRWASLETESAGVQAGKGVARLVVALGATEVDEQRRDLEALAKLYGLV
jgi:hypothetical protein